VGVLVEVELIQQIDQDYHWYENAVEWYQDLMTLVIWLAQVDEHIQKKVTKSEIHFSTFIRFKTKLKRK